MPSGIQIPSTCFVRKFSPEQDSVARIHVQQTDGRSTNICPSNKHTICLKGEMAAPCIVAGMEQWNNLSSHRIDRRKVRSLERVAAVACQRQIGIIIYPTMLPGDDVFDMKAGSDMNLQYATILTPLPCAASHKSQGCGIHQLARPARILRALAWRMETISMASTYP